MSLENAIADVGSDLAMQLEAVLDAIPGRPKRASQLSRMLGVTREVTGKVLAATALSDPLAAAHSLPGPAPLRRMLHGAANHDVPGDLIAAAEQAVNRFETLIRDELGDRDSFDALLGARLPEVRQRHERANRLAAFRAMSQLKGAMAETWLHTVLVHRCPDDESLCDVVHLYGTLGLRRLRPEVPVKFTYREYGEPSATPWYCIDGKPVELSDGTELDPYCEREPATFELLHINGGVVCMVAGSYIGPRRAVDKLLAEVRPAILNRYASVDPKQRKSFYVSPAIPVRHLQFDILIDEQAFPNVVPELRFYDTAVEGMASVNDRTRDGDRLEFDERIVALGRGLAQTRSGHCATYLPLLEHVFEQLNWDSQRFIGHRVAIDYPMYGSQTSFVYDGITPL